MNEIPRFDLGKQRHIAMQIDDELLIARQYAVKDLIDTDKLQELLQMYSDATGMATALLDIEGNVLIATNWQDACIQFHRQNPLTCANCHESDTVIAGQLAEGHKYNVYKCKNGLVDVATPVIVQGRHIANLFTGQFFLSPPNLDDFRLRAKDVGFDESSYLNAIKKVPIYSEDEIESHFKFLAKLAEMIAEMGVDKEKVMDMNRHLILSAEKIANIGHWELDLKTEKLTWSDEVFRIHGVTRGDYKPEVTTAINFYHQDDLPKVEKYVNGAIERGTGYLFKLRILRKDGTIRRVVCKGEVQLGPTGQPEKVYGTIQDITDFEALLIERDLLAKAASETTTGLVITDAKKRVTWVNKAFEKISGYDLRDVKGQSLGQFLQGENTDAETIARLRDGINEGKSIEVDILNYRKDGEPYWNNLKISPIKENNTITHFVGLQHDISEKVRQEDTIKQMQRLEMVGKLSAGIAHDFNNILGIISMNTEMLQLRNTQESCQKHIKNIELAVGRAANITEKLLKSSKEKTLSRERISIAAALEEIQALTQEIMPRNIDFKWHIDKDIQQNVNRADFQDAIINMIINAKNAITHHGTITINVCRMQKFNPKNQTVIYKPKQAASYIEISITDTGCGIPEDLYNTIFLPFETHSGQEGSGLGLSMVAGFVGRSGYGLSLISKLGLSTTFTISIPEQEHPQDIAHESEASSNNIGKQIAKNIVLVDDESQLRNALGEILELNNHRVVQFDSGESAIEYIRNNIAMIDVVITDETMPGSIQGHDIYEQFNNLVKVILVTGNPRELLDKIDNDAILQKPIRSEQLLQLINATEKDIPSKNQY